MNHVERKQKTIASLIEGDEILDVGFAEYPNKFLKGKVIGVDIQKVKKPENYTEVYQVNLNMENLPFEDLSFHTVILGEVLEHVENPSHLLRETNRVLKMYGKLIVSVPNATYYWEIIRNYFFSYKPSIDVGEHLSNWNILDMKRLLGKNGFKVNKLYGSVFTFPITSYYYIPVKNFPKLSWIIIYDCVKSNKPITQVITRRSVGIGNDVDLNPIRVDNIKYNEHEETKKMQRLQ